MADKLTTDFVRPIRVCCGQRHDGVECPDGFVMCCICFERVPVEALNLTLDGVPENVCAECGRRERDQNEPQLDPDVAQAALLTHPHHLTE